MMAMVMVMAHETAVLTLPGVPTKGMGAVPFGFV